MWYILLLLMTGLLPPPTMPWQKWWAAFVIPEFSSLRFQDHKSEVMQEAILQIKMKTLKSPVENINFIDNFYPLHLKLLMPHIKSSYVGQLLTETWGCAGIYFLLF